MLAVVGLSLLELTDLIEQIGPQIEIANYNLPDQTVVSGDMAQLRALHCEIDRHQKVAVFTFAFRVASIPGTPNLPLRNSLAICPRRILVTRGFPRLPTSPPSLMSPARSAMYSLDKCVAPFGGWKPCNFCATRVSIVSHRSDQAECSMASGNDLYPNRSWLLRLRCQNAWCRDHSLDVSRSGFTTSWNGRRTVRRIP